MGCCTSLARAEKVVYLAESVEVEARSKTDGQVDDPDQEQRASEFIDGYRHFNNEGGGHMDLGSYQVYGIDVPVMTLASATSEKIASLPRGTVVDVVGICCKGQPMVFWGRIQSPDGWIPLWHADSRLGQWVKLQGDLAHGAMASSNGRKQAQVDLSSPNTNDGCNQVLCDLNRVVSVMSCASCQNQNMPQMLRVDSPNGQHSCVGLYVIVPEKLPHGFPCWRLTPSGSRWLYSTKSGIWCIGGDDVTSDHFVRSAGFIFQGEAHRGKMPHEHGAPWHRWDGTSFVVDNSITILAEELEIKPAVPATSNPGEQQQSRELSEASTAAPPGSSQPLREFSSEPTERNRLSHEPSDEGLLLDMERRWYPGMPKLGEPKTSVGLCHPWSLNCWHVHSVETAQNRLLQQDSLDKPPSNSQMSFRPRSESSKRSKNLSREISSIRPTSISSPPTPRSPRSLLGSPRDKGAFPVVICIESPNVHTSCAGFYVLVVGARPNGRPLWKKRGARRWLYTGTDGKWYVGGPSSSKKKFRCESGYLCHQGDQDSGRPDRLQGPWSWGDAKAWYPDKDIAVRFAENFELRPVTSRIET